MVDRQGGGNMGQGSDRAQRYELAGARAHEHFRQIVRTLLEEGVELQNDGVIVAGGVNRGDLPRSERVVERRANLFRCEAEGRRLLTVDVQAGLRALDLQI